jgi:hypothetical protein
MNRNKMYIAVGGLIAIILIGLLIYLMNSQSDLSPKQTYKVEIYHCGPIAKDATVLTNEMSAFLLSSPIPSTTGFIAPVVDIHEKLKDGEVHSISIPKSGLTGLREMFVSDYYDYNARKEEEGDFIGEHGNFFSSEEFLSFSASALKGGDQAVDSVPYNKENCITEFFIYTNQPNINSADNKVWNSLASLKKYINGLIAEGKITSDNVIKVYFTCGPIGPPPPPPSDLDKDGVDDSNDQCPNEKGQVECSGCPCPPPPACPGDSDSDRDGICDSEDKCPNEFGTKKYGGCKIPDSDGDGVIDENDNCKDEYGSKEDGGCPGIGSLTISNGGVVSWSGTTKVLYLSIRFSKARDKEIMPTKEVKKGDKIEIPGVHNTNDQQFYIIKYGRSKGNLGDEITVKCTNFL